MITKINCGPLVDELGRLQARIADLKKQETALKAELRDQGPGAYEGRLFRATVGEPGERTSYDGREMADRLWELGLYAFVKEHTRVAATDPAVRVVARNGMNLEEAA